MGQALVHYSKPDGYETKEPLANHVGLFTILKKAPPSQSSLRLSMKEVETGDAFT